MFDHEIAALQVGQHRLPERDRTFASSLLAQLGRRGTLSDKQWPWIKTLADRLAALDNPDAAKPAATSLGDMAPLMAMFARAAEKLKFPHLLLRLNETQRAKVWIAGSRARCPGSLTVVDADTRERLGSIMPTGAWEPAGHLHPTDAAQIAAVLAELIAAPIATLAKHGKLLGACCFCRSTLSDERSTEMGYGPICAKNWGLPWGKSAKRVCDQPELIAA